MSPYKLFENLSYVFALLLSTRVFIETIKKDIFINKIWFLWIFFAVVFFIFSRLIYQTPSLLVVTISLNVAIGLWLAQFKGSILYIKVIFFMVASWIISQYFLSSFSNPLSGIQILDNLIQGSANHITILILSLYSTYAFLLLKNTNKVPVFSSFIVLAISMMTLGRSAIVASAFLVFWLLLVSGHKKIIYSLIAFVLLYFIFVNPTYVDTLSGYLERFEGMDMTQDPRIQILKKYFSELDTVSLLFGHDVLFSREVDSSLSTHNSFLSIHQGSGILGLLLVLLIFFFELWLILTLSPYAGILGAIIIRSFTDSGNFIGGFLMGAVSIGIIVATTSSLLIKKSKNAEKA